MKSLLLIPVTYVIGFFTAIPVGATQIEIAKRALRGYTRAALMIVAGSVTSDLMYGFIAMFGLAPFLRDKKVVAFFWSASAIILFILGWFTLARSKKYKDIAEKDSLSNRNIALFLGFSLAVTNPPMILWWLLCSEFVKSLGLVSNFTSNASVTFLLAGGAGIASYLVTLTLILRKAGKFLTRKTEYKINFALGVVLLVLAVYFAVRSVKIFLS